MCDSSCPGKRAEVSYSNGDICEVCTETLETYRRLYGLAYTQDRVKVYDEPCRRWDESSQQYVSR
jgi:hypothetical protein